MAIQTKTCNLCLTIYAIYNFLYSAYIFASTGPMPPANPCCCLRHHCHTAFAIIGLCHVVQRLQHDELFFAASSSCQALLFPHPPSLIPDMSYAHSASCLQCGIPPSFVIPSTCPTPTPDSPIPIPTLLKIQPQCINEGYFAAATALARHTHPPGILKHDGDAHPLIPCRVQ